jgi:hypothetical protein
MLLLILLYHIPIKQTVKNSSTITNIISKPINQNMTSTQYTIDQSLSIYIPRCDTRSLPRRSRDMSDEQYEQAVKAFIANQFKYQHIGDVARVDLVPKQTADSYVYYIAFVHFAQWHNTEQAETLQADILSDKRAKIQFHERWFWICNKNQKPLTAEEVEQAKLEWQQQQQMAMWHHQQQQMAMWQQQMAMMQYGQQLIQPGAAQLAVQGFSSAPADFPPLNLQPSQLVRQTNMRPANMIE